MYQSAPWGTRIFLNPQRGDVQAISKLLTFVLEHLKCMEVFCTRSEVGFIKYIQCSELLITIKQV
jgi:hypothetical protein